jgi:protein-tyrosine-phosphatase
MDTKQNSPEDENRRKFLREFMEESDEILAILKRNARNLCELEEEGRSLRAAIKRAGRPFRFPFG